MRKNNSYEMYKKIKKTMAVVLCVAITVTTLPQNMIIIKADEIIISLTDIDFKFIYDTHYIDSYEIIESYYSLYKYLPKKLINFILDKYVAKTSLKNVKGKEDEYQRIKGMFNAIYGMSVTNNIRDDVIFDNDKKEWSEVEIDNDKIIELLSSEKKKSFLSFSYGVWVTAHARNNLLRRVIDLDEYVIYCDTDSIKLRSGYNKDIFYIQKNVQKKENVEKQLLPNEEKDKLNKPKLKLRGKRKKLRKRNAKQNLRLRKKNELKKLMRQQKYIWINVFRIAKRR